MDIEEKLELCEREFETQKHKKTCLINAVYNSLVYLEYVNENSNFRVEKDILKKWGYPPGIKNPKGNKETIYDLFRAEIKSIKECVEDKLKNLNYELESNFGINTYDSIIDVCKHPKHSLPIVNVSIKKLFENLYGIEADSQGNHAINVIQADEEKVIIFDPMYQVIIKKDIDQTKIDEKIYREVDGVFEISQNLFTNWWGSAEDRYWVWIFKQGSQQPSLFEFENDEEKVKNEIQKHERRD